MCLLRNVWWQMEVEALETSVFIGSTFLKKSVSTRLNDTWHNCLLKKTSGFAYKSFFFFSFSKVFAVTVKDTWFVHYIFNSKVCFCYCSVKVSFFKLLTIIVLWVSAWLSLLCKIFYCSTNRKLNYGHYNENRETSWIYFAPAQKRDCFHVWNVCRQWVSKNKMAV